MPSILNLKFKVGLRGLRGRGKQDLLFFLLSQTIGKQVLRPL